MGHGTWDLGFGILAFWHFGIWDLGFGIWATDNDHDGHREVQLPVTGYRLQVRSVKCDV